MKHKSESFFERWAPDPHSLKFKLWLYFSLLAAVILVIIWFLQIFFLNNYYQTMKIHETKKIAASITSQYRGNIAIVDEIRDMSLTNDMYIHIETTDGTIIFSPVTEEGRRPSYAYVKEMGAAREQLLEGTKKKSVSIIIPEDRTNTNTLAYAGYLQDNAGENAILYIFSPLYPVSSTVEILQRQLIYITVIALILTFILAFYLSNRISRPIKKISSHAGELAKGNYGITFEGGSYSEIIELADTLTTTSLALEKSSDMQRDLIANVSHDLRTPLTMVKSYAEMIRDLSGDNKEKREDHLQVIIEEADRLNGLVSDMLSISRLQSGVMVVEKNDFNLRTAMEAILQSYNLWARQEGYEISFTCPELIMVTADETKIKQVFYNLLNNAFKYCGDDKKICIKVTVEGKVGGSEKVRCEIIDRGPGIPPEDLEHIWERYYKASTNTVRASTGSGLGLSIVKEILLLHNAKFGVISAPGEGSTFWFELIA